MKVVGTISCTWCGGTQFVSEITTPFMEKFVVPCPQDKLQDRFDEVMARLGTRVSRDVIRLRRNLSTMFISSTYVGIPCPRCPRTPGSELRLVQTGPPKRETSP